MSRQFLIACILLLAIKSCQYRQAHADQVLAGGLTYHVINADSISHMYKGCIVKPCALIYTPLVGYRFEQSDDASYVAHTPFAGGNSIHQPIVGYLMSFGGILDNHKLGLAQGLYLQDDAKFRQKGIVPFSIHGNGSLGVVPILGLEHQYRLHKNLFTNAVLSPIIVNVGIAYQF